MVYVGNSQYRVIVNGQEVTASANEFREAMLDILKFEGKTVNDYVETCPAQYIYENSARYELLCGEIKDSGWKHLKWSDEMEEAFEIVTECAMKEARDYYEHLYIMQRKF